MLKRKGQAAVTGVTALAVAFLVLVSACEGAPARPKPWRRDRAPEVTAPVAPPGSATAIAEERAAAMRKRAHSLRIRLEAEPAQLNPMVDPDESAVRVAEDTIFETLLRVEPGATPEQPAKLVPHLAESYRVLYGGSEIRVTLRDGLTFHDGHKLDVTDVQYSLDVARGGSARSPRLREALADVITVELLSPRELRLTLRRPSAFVVRALAEVPILPQHIYRGAGDLARHPRNRQPIGSGPYRLVLWDKGRRLVLARNETYWGKAPPIEEIEFVIEPDGARALTRAKRGEIDLIPALAPAHVPDQVAAMAPDFVPLRLRPVRVRYLVMNTVMPPFDDVRVRAAVAHLIDRPKLIEEVGRGLLRVAPGPVWPGGPGDGVAPTPPPYDLAAAGRLLDEAGWTDADGDGVRERGGDKLRAIWLVTSEGRGDPERELIAAALRKAGFVVEQRPGEPAVLMVRLRSGEFGLALVDWKARADEDLSPLLYTRGARNYGGYSSKAMDAALDGVRAAFEPALRATRIVDVATLVSTEWPIVPIVSPDPLGLVHTRVRGLVIRDGWFSIRELSLSE